MVGTWLPWFSTFRSLHSLHSELRVNPTRSIRCTNYKREDYESTKNIRRIYTLVISRAHTTPNYFQRVFLKLLDRKHSFKTYLNFIRIVGYSQSISMNKTTNRKIPFVLQPCFRTQFQPCCEMAPATSSTALKFKWPYLDNDSTEFIKIGQCTDSAIMIIVRFKKWSHAHKIFWKEQIT